jgi:cellulose synthase operon protein C
MKAQTMMFSTPSARVIGLALILTACSSPEEQKQRHFEQGNAYVAEKRDDFAVIEYANAVRIDPKFGEARLKLAETYERMNNIRAAYPEYIRAADALPNDRALQIKVTELLLLGNQFEDAKARATAILEKNPRDVDAMLLRANAMARLQDPDSALDEIQEALKLTPNDSRLLVTLGDVRELRGEPQDAEAAFRRAIEIDPKSVAAHLSLANFLWSSRRPEEAEQQIKHALSIEPNHILANRMMATLYRATKRTAEAEAPLKVMATRNPAAKFELADYYLGADREGEATKLLTELTADQASSARAETMLAALDYGKGRTKEAHARLDKLLMRAPNDTTALVTKAQWLAREKKLDEALERAKAAVASDPQSAAAQFVLGAVLSQQSNNPDAIKAYTEALRLNPRLAAAQVELSRLNQQAGNTDAALRFAEEARQSAPNSIETRIALVRTLLLRGERDRAGAEITQLLGRYPNVGQVHALNGLLLTLRNNDASARAAFEKALTLSPGSAEALGGLIALDLKNKQIDSARQRIDTAIAQNPDRVELLSIGASVYERAGQPSRAEQLLRRAVTVDPNSLAGYTSLAQFYMRQRRLDEARSEFEGIVKRDSRSVGPRTMVGIILESQGKRAEAKKWYEATVTDLPTAALASNNLAFMYAEEGTNLDKALTLASNAKRGLPDSPQVNDTLGWVYYKKDLPSLAVGPLEDSAQKLPDNADVLYHLGMTYAKLGDKAKARNALERALTINPKFGGAAAARQTLESVSK